MFDDDMDLGFPCDTLADLGLAPHREFTDFRINSLMAVLGHGESEATTRRALRRILDIGDRELRRVIEKARVEGCLIVNDQDGRGYYLPASMNDLRRQAAQNGARIRALQASSLPIFQAVYSRREWEKLMEVCPGEN